MPSIILLIAVIIIYFVSSDSLNEIRDNASIASGIVVDYDSGYRGGLEIKVEFVVDGKQYYATNKYVQIPFPSGSNFSGRSLPVIYSRKHPNKNQILLFRDDFEDFNMTYPDSLRWALQYCTK